MCYWSSHISPAEGWTVTLRPSTDQATYNSSNSHLGKYIYMSIRFILGIKSIFHHNNNPFSLGPRIGLDMNILCHRYQHVGI